MSQYLPIQAINRSQRVRIGGKTIRPGITTYVDLGYLDSPLKLTETVIETGKKSQVNAGGESEGFKKEKYFGYAVSAVDATGGETPVGPLLVFKSGKGAEAENELNFNEITWTAVPNATKYYIYRSGKSATGLSKAEAEAAVPVRVAETTAGKYKDTGATLTTTKPTGTNNTFYNTSGTGWSTRHELQNHSAIGAIFIVGNVTPNPSDWAPWSASAVFTPEAEKVKITEVEWIQRSTGLIVKVPSAEPTAKKVESGKERVTLIVYNPILNLFQSVEGSEETAGSASVATVEATLASYQYLLQVYKTTSASTTPVLFSGGDVVNRAVL